MTDYEKKSLALLEKIAADIAIIREAASTYLTREDNKIVAMNNLFEPMRRKFTTKA